MKLTPRRWADFQHYKNRRPPWIKLHKSLLDDREYQRLPLASRALAPMLWLLASESDDGVFDGSIEELTFRLRQPARDIESGLAPLIDAGFFSVVHEASSVLADCQQLVPQRREETETETETETDSRSKSAKPRSRKISDDLTFAEWANREKQSGKKLISEYAPVWAFADKAGIQREWVEIGWIEFSRRFSEDPNHSSKKQKDWRAHFAKFVRNNWLHVWELDRTNGGYRLTTAGAQMQREHEAQEVAA